MNKTLITRRSVIQGTLTGAALAGGLLPGGALAAAEPVADTAAGKVRGVVTDGIFTFKGIPYGASTAGANRFMPPQKPEKWDGIRDALHLGPQAPQNPNDWSPELQALWPKPVGGDPEPNSEDCLVLNVWTPGLKGKRPVMVWIHGGGYSFGSDGPYPGLNLAKFGDVVVVGINHRLNIFGYLYLGGIGGEKYAASGNAGMLDIVASLEWVRENIKAFGGDPGNVTIFGQSGGAAKVTTLMAMPAAKGLFHRAIAQSDYALGVKAMPAADAAKVTEAVLAQLGLKPEELDMLQQLPMERLIAAMNLTKSVSKFGPVMDGGALPRDPFDPDAPDTSADVPLLIGTTATETTSLLLMTGGGPAMFDLDEAGVKARIVALGHLEPAAAECAVRALCQGLSKGIAGAAVLPDHLGQDIPRALDHHRRAQGRARQGRDLYVSVEMGDAGAGWQVRCAAHDRAAPSSSTTSTTRPTATPAIRLSVTRFRIRRPAPGSPSPARAIPTIRVCRIGRPMTPPSARR